MARRRLGFLDHIRTEWMLLAGLACMVVFGIGMTREVMRRRAIRAEIQSLQAQADRLSSRRDELSQLIKDFQTTTVQEREARTKLNLLKPGEKSIVIQTPTHSGTESSADTSSASSSDATSNPSRWWDYFFGLAS